MLPGWHVSALEDVDLRALFKFYPRRAAHARAAALLRDGGDGDIVADCRLIGRRTLPGKGEQETVHLTGRAPHPRSAGQPAGGSSPDGEPSAAGEVNRDAVYEVYFHGPAYQVLECAWRADGGVVGRLVPICCRPTSHPAN